MAKQTIVGSPLTPALLKDLGAFDTFPSAPRDFNPAGEWVNTYRIWTCHGYNVGNKNVGFLRIERIPVSEKTFELKVRQEVLQTDAILGIIDGTITCQNDSLASPIRWNLSSRIIGADGESIPELLSKDNGTATESMGTTTGDWCLFEAVQRVPPEMQASLSFDLLEGMSLRKSKHRLSYHSMVPTNIETGDILLHHFTQFGSGILPTEYWLDTHHRLLIVTSMNKAYILDERAENIFTRDVERARKTYLKRTSQRK
jgi:hypothetical protein